MRELKFRAWDGKRMIYPNDNPYLTSAEILSRYEEPMQFTGLKDKNGKEIYEGDIIQFKYYFVNKRWWSSLNDIPIIEKECEDQRNDIKSEKNTVRFVDGSFVLNYPLTLKDIARGERYKKSQSHNCDTEEKQWDFEVIGNIYENPELL